MASNVLQVLGFVLGVLAWAGMIGTCASPEWRKNSQGQTLIDNILRYDGLWVRCKSFATGQTHCEDYNAFFIGLPGVLQICRGLMIASIVVGFIAIIVTVFGLKCVNVGGSNSVVKPRIALTGGLLFAISGICASSSVYFAFLWITRESYEVMKGFYFALAMSGVALVASLFIIFGSCCFISTPTEENDIKFSSYSIQSKSSNVTAALNERRLTGILTGAAVSHYAQGVVQEFYNPANPSALPMYLRFEYGYALFIGWATLVLGLLSGVTLVVSSIYILTRSSRPQPVKSYRRPTAPVLQRPFQTENIPLQTYSPEIQQPIPAQRRLKIENGVNEERFIQHNAQINGESRSRRDSVSTSRSKDRRRRRRSLTSSSERSRSRRGGYDNMAADVYSSRQRHRRSSNETDRDMVQSVSESVKQYL